MISTVIWMILCQGAVSYVVIFVFFLVERGVPGYLPYEFKLSNDDQKYIKYKSSK